MRQWGDEAVGQCGSGTARQWGNEAVQDEILERRGSGAIRQWGYEAVGQQGSGRISQWDNRQWWMRQGSDEAVRKC
jgi:hypothetical protein